MKIAVPVTNQNQIDGHFGHCESYNVYTISDKSEITGVKNVESPQGCGCKSDIASVLASDGVTVMLAGGIGGGALIGWVIDRFAGTSPWGLLVMMFLGIIVSFRNIIRISSRRPD